MHNDTRTPHICLDLFVHLYNYCFFFFFFWLINERVDLYETTGEQYLLDMQNQP